MILSVGLGLAAASAASLAFAGRPQTAAVASIDARLSAISGRRPKPIGAAQALALQGPSLFPVFSGPGAAPEMTVLVQGIARSPLRTAALLSVNGAPAEWVGLGESVQGVVLEDVSSGGVTIDTPRGVREVRLGEGGAGAGAGAPIESAAADAPPPGYRMPPEPASAPGAPQ